MGFPLPHSDSNGANAERKIGRQRNRTEKGELLLSLRIERNSCR